MPWGAAIGAVGAIGSAAISANASGGAAGAQGAGGQAGIAALQQALSNANSNLGNFWGTGVLANSALQNQLGLGGDAANPTFNPNAPLVTPFTATQFQQSPGYNWQLQQGTGAILNNAAAAGGVGGNALKALQSYGTGLANQDYYNAYNKYTQDQNNLFNRLFSVSQQGQNAGTALANTALGVGTNVAGIQGQIGNANAAGIVGQSNALTSGLSNLGQLAYLYGSDSNGGSSGGLGGLLSGLFSSPSVSAPGFMGGSYDAGATTYAPSSSFYNY